MTILVKSLLLPQALSFFLEKLHKYLCGENQALLHGMLLLLCSLAKGTGNCVVISRRQSGTQGEEKGDDRPAGTIIPSVFKCAWVCLMTRLNCAPSVGFKKSIR